MCAQCICDSDVDNTSAVTATGTNGANAIIASGRAVRVESKTNTGVESIGHIGVRAFSNSGDGYGIWGAGATGVTGTSDSGTGVHGESQLGEGVRGVSHSSDHGAVVGTNEASGIAVHGESKLGEAVRGVGHSSDHGAVVGTNDAISGIGVHGRCDQGHGVVGFSQSPTGGAGIYGRNTAPIGANERNIFEPGTHIGAGVFGQGVIGVLGTVLPYDIFGDGFGVVGVGWMGVSGRGGYAGVIGEGGQYAGKFNGDVLVTGTLTKGRAYFKIDHPLDPENKYLYHSAVESPDMLNIYNGNTTTDVDGDATIKLPDYFEALNQDFRYQLTVIGQFAQAIVAEEIRTNQFMIKTDKPNVRVSWQVTGVRKDPFANLRRIVIEEETPADERGLYLHPEAHGKPESQGIRSLHEKRLRTRDGQSAP
jgi:hypothetical protein